jgi:alkylhydroperoxidase family enzyme
VTEEQIQALKDPGGVQREVFTAEERAAVLYARLLTKHPSGVRQEDLDELGKHFNAELILVIGTANLTNRFNDGLRVPVDVQWRFV